ncbi:putative transporter [Weissella oryzae SG25]|uniref:Putative transporter n=2 Tax=Weissella TaxID=46255 RepID=A0A069D0T4_WEIOS|nr:putative transporter [Weissella oryzae SG25]
MIAGFLLANQSPINADLRGIVHSPFIAAAISFIVGTVFLAVIAWIQTGQLLPSWTVLAKLPWWLWLGGVLGLIYLTSNILLFSKIGAIQTVILPMLGQIVMGIFIDTFGWFNSPVLALSFWRLAGIVTLFLGVIIAVVVPNLGNRVVVLNDEAKDVKIWLWQVWAVIIGGFGAIQQAINGHLGVVLASPVQATLISFGLGSILIVILAYLVERRMVSWQELKQTRPWNWLGGFLGALFVLTAVIALPHIGAGMTIMMGLLGQITGSILVQQFGWWHSIKKRVVPAQIIGIIIMLVGVGLIKFL